MSPRERLLVAAYDFYRSTEAEKVLAASAEIDAALDAYAASLRAEAVSRAVDGLSEPDAPEAPPHFDNAQASAWQCGWSSGWAALRRALTGGTE